MAPGPAIVRQAAGPAGELAVGGGGERGGALVADADVGEPPGLLLAAQRVGEAEVRVADHPEDVLDAPVDHRLGHQVGDGRDVRARARRRRRPRRRGSRAGRWSPRRRSRATCRRAGSSRSRATGSAAARSRSSPRRAGRPGAGSGCRAPRTGRRSGRARRSCGRPRRWSRGPRAARRPPARGATRPRSIRSRSCSLLAVAVSASLRVLKKSSAAVALVVGAASSSA